MIALLLPVVAFAQNMALQKTMQTTVDASRRNETRLHVPFSAAGLPEATPSNATDPGYNYSVGMWVNVSDVNTTRAPQAGVIFRMGNDHANRNGTAVLTTDGSGALTMSIACDHLFGTGSFSAGSITLNDWQHILLVFDSTNGNARVYVNGVETANDNTVQKFGYNWGDGKFQLLGQNITAKLDELQFFNKALTADEAAQAYANAARVDGLSSLYTFDAVKEGTTGQFESIAGSVADQVATFQYCSYEAYWGGQDGLVTLLSANETTSPLVEGRVVAVEEYTVNIAANPAAGGNVEFTSPASSESSLATTTPNVTVKATANLGWVFRNWTDGNDNVVSTDPTYTYTDAVDATLTANFVQVKTYTVNITQPENGTITVTADGNNVTSGATLNQNTVLTISATPASGYQLANYLVNGVATSNPQVVVTSNLTISAFFEVAAAGPSYCAPSGNTSRADNRGISKLDVSDDNGNSIEVTGPGVGTAQALYVDRTGTILTTTAGATITVKNNGSGTWMHSYIYIDINQNGVFDVNEANCHGANVDGELFSHTGYTGVNGDNPSVFSDGTTLNNDVYQTSYNLTMPSFTLPADLAPGTYRIRHKIDWNCVDPCGRLAANGYSGNFMNENGGGIIDFTIKIDEPQYTLTYSATGNGDIEARVGVTQATNPTASGYAIVSGSAIENDVYVILTPKQYKGEINTIASATLNGDNVIDLLTTYTARNENEATYYYIRIPKADVTEDQVFTAVFEGEVQGIDGIGIDPANGPVEYYNLQGVRVAAENLVPGFYVLRQGSKAVKVFIRK